ncbi:TolC family protein [Aestuariibaculum sp. M13]|uniref:TolC family protein n=1 Tax=Aestuariibaculum sp. M13 TaxID=2967132 RepID=UPI002159D0E6|nr:TolC family protein [Aestuariibaculum sp. M13]MCR8667548.1 TolC family protein [Aestuariibaculum sp. M13]
MTTYKYKIEIVFVLLGLILFNNNLNAQEDLLVSSKGEITLKEVLKIASKSSLDAFKAKRKYEYSYWDFRSFKASVLPQIDFNTAPLTYRSSVIERYDSNLNQDVFRPVQSLNSYAGLSLSQNILQTGGRISLNSTYNKLTNYNDGITNSYNVTPVNIALSQPLMAFNSFKWLKRTAPLEFSKSQKELVYELQSINVKTVSYFFAWALAAKKVVMARENLASSKKMYGIGKKRYDIGSIEKEDLLNLELQLYNAETNLTIEEKNLIQVKNNLTIFLRDDLENYNVPVLPELISDLKIDLDSAIELYKENNPQMLDLEINNIEAERDLDRAIKENRFDLSISASYGLNQQADVFADVYHNLLEQQLVSVNFRIPILDWGERKGNIKKAKMNKEVQEIDRQQEESRLIQDIETKVRDFNLQEQLVQNALKASEISKESYIITEKRFLAGRVDLLKLTSALNAWQSSNESYMSKLANYWRYYYELQQYTLYNFMESRAVQIDIEKGILD